MVYTEKDENEILEIIQTYEGKNSNTIIYHIKRITGYGSIRTENLLRHLEAKKLIHRKNGWRFYIGGPAQ